jgi:ABC-type antimicrobial peptide transport system permease subunit
MATLLADLRFGLRMLRRNPGFAAVAVATLGLALGLPASLALSQTPRSFLFGITPGDPLTLAAVSVLLAAAALLAAYVPARRATRVDPMVALRAE